MAAEFEPLTLNSTNSSTAMSDGARPWTDPDLLYDLIDGLRVYTGRIGIDEYIGVQQVLLAAAARGDSLDNPEDVRRLIAPLLCTTADEQADFAQRFDQWLKRSGMAPASPATQAPASLEQELKEIETKDRLRWVWAAVALVAVTIIAALLLLPRLSPQLYARLWPWAPPTPTAQAAAPEVSLSPTPIPPTRALEFGTPVVTPAGSPAPLVAPTPEVIIATRPLDAAMARLRDLYERLYWSIALLALLPVLLATWLARRLWYHHRAGLFLQRRKTDEPPDITRVLVKGVNEKIYETGEMHAVARLLRRRTPTLSRTINVDRTLARSIERGGWFTPVYNRRRQTPEYLILIDRLTYRDHVAQQADALIDALRNENLYYTRYYFEGNPLLCRPESVRARAVTLGELSARHAGQRLLIFGGAECVLDPVTGEPDDWVKELNAWSMRGLFTPTPPTDWSVLEQRASQVLGVWPCLPEGLEMFARDAWGEGGELYASDRFRRSPIPAELVNRPVRWLQHDPPDPATVSLVLKELRGYLGDWGYSWFSACAIYPEVNWNLTLFLGYMLKVDAEKSARAIVPDVFNRTLVDMARLPWMRYGTIPDWLRRTLLAGMNRDDERRLRTALQGLLLTAVADPSESFALEIVQGHSSTVRRLAAPLLSILRRDAGARSPLRDRVFLTFMSGTASTALALRVPERLRAFFQGEGQARRELTTPSAPPGVLRTSAATTNATESRGNDREGEVSRGGWRSLLPSRWRLLYVGLVAATAIALAVGYQLVIDEFFPSRMVGSIRVAIADFGQQQSNGSMTSSAAGSEISQIIFQELADHISALSDEDALLQDATIWHDSMGRAAKNVVFGVIEGSSAEDRAENATRLAQRVDADLVIYGFLEPDDGSESERLRIEFYGRSFVPADEPFLSGYSSSIYAPIEFPVAWETNPELVRLALSNDATRRVALIFWVLLSRQQNFLDNPDVALRLLDIADEELLAMEDNEGKDALYFTRAQAAQIAGEYDRGLSDIDKVIAIRPDSAIAHITRGAIQYRRAEWIEYDWTTVTPEQSMCYAGSPPETTELTETAARADVANAIADLDTGLEMAGATNDVFLVGAAQVHRANAYRVLALTELTFRNYDAAQGALANAQADASSAVAFFSVDAQPQWAGYAQAALGTVHHVRAALYHTRATEYLDAGDFEQAQELARRESSEILDALAAYNECITIGERKPVDLVFQRVGYDCTCLNGRRTVAELAAAIPAELIDDVSMGIPTPSGSPTSGALDLAATLSAQAVATTPTETEQSALETESPTPSAPPAAVSSVGPTEQSAPTATLSTGALETITPDPTSSVSPTPIAVVVLPVGSGGVPSVATPQVPAEITNAAGSVIAQQQSQVSPPQSQQVAPSDLAPPQSLSSLNFGESIVLRGHSGAISAVDFSPDGTLLATGSADTQSLLWDMTSDDPSSAVLQMQGGDSAVWDAVFSSDGRFYAAAKIDGSTYLWDFATQGDVTEVQQVVSVPTNVVNWIVFSPDSLQYATASDEFTTLWNVEGAEQEIPGIRLQSNDGGIRTLEYSPDGRWLAVGSESAAVVLWDLHSQSVSPAHTALLGHTGSIDDIAFSPDGNWLASASWDTTVRLWDPISGEGVAVLGGHTAPVNTVAFSADGRWLASASDDGTARLWDMTSDDPSQNAIELTGHSAGVFTAAFSSDGRWLATASFDNTARLWDLTSDDLSQITIELAGHTDWVTELAFSPDARWLATGSDDGTVRIWNVQGVDQLSTAD